LFAELRRWRCCSAFRPPGRRRPGDRVSATLSVVIRAPLTIAFTPPNPTIDCLAPAGTVVATVATAGGSGTPVTLSISGGDNVDFAMPGSNVLVATGGIAPGHCGATQNLTVTATQP
jgi:hypothetical protein